MIEKNCHNCKWLSVTSTTEEPCNSCRQVTVPSKWEPIDSLHSKEKVKQ